MDDAVLVGELDGLRKHHGDLGRFVGGECSVIELLRQRAAADIFQHEIRLARVNADFVNLHDIRMHELGDCGGFRLKTAFLVFVGIRTGLDHFHGHHARQLQVLRQTHHAHAAFAEDSQDLKAGDVVRQLLLRGRARVIHRRRFGRRIDRRRGLKLRQQGARQGPRRRRCRAGQQRLGFGALGGIVAALLIEVGGSLLRRQIESGGNDLPDAMVLLGVHGAVQDSLNMIILYHGSARLGYR